MLMEPILVYKIQLVVGDLRLLTLTSFPRLINPKEKIDEGVILLAEKATLLIW